MSAQLGNGKGPEMKKIIAAGQGVSLDYVNQLLAACAIDESSMPSILQLGLIEPLGERELEILQLIAAGLSNREIADQLVIAQSTVKWHINNLYRKLDVRSRTQAVARGRELKLLK